MSKFTSHYVSINSRDDADFKARAVYLHPTMYLLIHYQTTTSDEQLANLHPTMYLLIRMHSV